MARRSKHYINNRDFFTSLEKFLTECKEAEKNGVQLPRIPDYIGKAFMLLCQRISTRGNFAMYSYKDEMIGDGIENCVMQVRSFNPAKSQNPFAYFSTIISNAFVRRIKKEKRQFDVKLINMNNLYMSEEIIVATNGKTSKDRIIAQALEATARSNTKPTPNKKKKTSNRSLTKFIESP